MKKTNKIGLLYFGRLESEKGFDLILDMLTFFLKTEKELPFKIFIFGDGSLKDKLLDISEQSKDIHYFGRKPLEEIERYKDNCDYLLMPSKCLETFGLSALTACSRGLSVIGFAKGGQQQFIHPEYNLSTVKASTKSAKLITMIKKILDQKSTPKNINKAIVKHYTKQQRIANAVDIFGKDKKILIINDFIEKKGGIETYLHDATEILQKEGYEVILLGKKNIPKQKRKKHFYTLASICNIKSYIKIKKMIKAFEPDAIWFNNMFRYHGWLGLSACKSSQAKKIIMYHDLGYFFPYPSKLENEKQIHYPSNPRNFIRSIPNATIVQKVGARYKGVQNQLLKKQVKNQCDIHLVPSRFMEKIVHKSFKIKNEKIKTLPHFLQE